MLFKKPKLEVTFEVHIIVEKNDCGYIAYCPGLKGLAVEGDTLTEVKQNFDDAFIAYIRSTIKNRDPLPLCSTFKIKKTHNTEYLVENIKVPLKDNLLSLKSEKMF